MPLYEYECEACGERFEVIHKSFSDPAPDACRKCGKGPITRQMSSPAIQFKGSGFYITDYAKKSSEGTSEGGSTKGKSTTDESKSDSAAKTGDAPKTDTAAKTDTASKNDTAPKKTESTSTAASTNTPTTSTTGKKD